MEKLLSAVSLTLSLAAAMSASAWGQKPSATAQDRWLAAASPKEADSIEGVAPGLVTIYSNLGPKGNYYNPNGGWIAAGPQDPYTNQQQDVAIPFTPQRNAVVTAIAVPFQYYGYGKNAATIELAADASGVPGAILSGRDGANLPSFGSGCCQLAVWNLKTGVAVTAGTQYWVVATTYSKSNDSAYVWDYNWNGIISTIAVQDNNNGWGLITFLTSPAAGVFGTLQ